MQTEQLSGETDHYVMGEPLRIGQRRVLLIDDYMIEDRWGVQREATVPLKHPRNPVLVQDKPWDNPGYAASVLLDRDARLFRMWYQALPDWR